MDALLDISILSWNIRGAHNRNSRRHMKDLIRKHNPTFLAINETHVPFAKLFYFFTNNGFKPIQIVEAQGHYRGIWLLQNVAATSTSTVIDFNNFSITFNIQRGDSNTFCTCIYASPNPTLHPNLWNHLTTINQHINSPWMLIGDFDETLFPSDQRGGIFNRNRAITFSTFLDNCNLLNLTTIGGSFTWHCNNNGLCILSKKLDRGLANVAWRLAFPEAFVEVLCRLHSDHNPLLLRFGGLPINRGIRPFRFEATWIDHEDYADLVDRAWRSSNHNITSALGKVRDQSIIFNLAVFGNIFRRKNKGGKQAEGGPKVS